MLYAYVRTRAAPHGASARCASRNDAEADDDCSSYPFERIIIPRRVAATIDARLARARVRADRARGGEFRVGAARRRGCGRGVGAHCAVYSCSSWTTVRVDVDVCARGVVACAVVDDAERVIVDGCRAPRARRERCAGGR